MTKKLAKNTKVKYLSKGQQTSIRDKVRVLAVNTESIYDPSLVIKNTWDSLTKWVEIHRKGKNAIQARKEFDNNLAKAIAIFELENFNFLSASAPEEYKPLAIEFVRRIIKEYDCKTPSEIALAEIVTSAYIRQLRTAALLSTSIEADWLSTERNARMAILSKELDRAIRTYITSLTTLKQIKNPLVELNVKATTTFVAENQQINVSNNKGENNERQ